MNGKPSALVTPLTISAIRIACSSLSITHGPAMRKRLPEPMRTSPIWKSVLNSWLSVFEDNWSLSGLPSRYFLWPVKHLHRRSLSLGPPLRTMLVRCRNERTEQRMRLQRLRLELGMELAADEMRMIRQFHHLYVSTVRRRPRNSQSRRHHRLLVFAVEFVAMAVALADFQLAVDFVGQRVGLNLASPCAQPHGAAQFFDAAQLAQLVDHAMRRRLIELA